MTITTHKPTAVEALREALIAVDSEIVLTGHLKEIVDAALAAQPEESARPTDGWVTVPREPTMEMLNAAIDVDTFRLGDISPLGFRMSPQKLFEKCYRAMLSAAPAATGLEEWHEIESAPKDGSEILVAGGRYHHPMDYDESGTPMDEHVWLARWDGYRWEGEEKDGHDNNYTFTGLTHWHPLPKFIRPLPSAPAKEV